MGCAGTKDQVVVIGQQRPGKSLGTLLRYLRFLPPVGRPVPLHHLPYCGLAPPRHSRQVGKGLGRFFLGPHVERGARSSGRSLPRRPHDLLGRDPMGATHLGQYLLGRPRRSPANRLLLCQESIHKLATAQHPLVAPLPLLPPSAPQRLPSPRATKFRYRRRACPTLAPNRPSTASTSWASYVRRPMITECPV